MENKKNDSHTIIAEAKAKLGRNAAEIISKDLNLEQWNDKKACCPFHRENTPSFVWCDDDKHGGGNFFKCFGCGKRYDIIDHYIYFEHLTYQQAIKKLFESQGFEYKEPPKSHDDYFKNYKYPIEETKKNKTNVEQYLTKRHISIQTLDYAEIKESKDGNIVFEYRNIDNTLLNCKYRAARAIKKGENKMWFQSGASNCPALFNMQRINITQPLVCTEGECDTLAVIESGYTNVVSIPYGANNSSWIEFNYEFLEQFEKIILWFDNDEAGQKALKEISPRLGLHRTYFVSPTDDILKKLKEAKDKNLISDNKCDANNVLIACGKQDVIRLIETARENENENLTYLLDYDEIDLQSMEKYPSGITAFDEILFGTLINTLTIITGKPGSGKSVLANLLGVHSAVNAGYKAMIFSGELKPELLSGWMLRPFASKRHIIEWKNEGKPSGYSVTVQSKKAIRKAYRDNIILYKKKVKGFSTKPEELFEAIEYSYKKYGCRVFTIDNMMCVSFGFGEGKYDEQRQFIGELIDLAERLPIAIILAVHTTKDDADVSGVAEVLRMAHRCIYDKRLENDNEGYHAYLEVWKERIVGGTAGKKIKLYYDIPTMRLYSNGVDLEFAYSWENEANIEYPKDLLERLVCNQKDETNEILGDDKN